VKEQDQQKPGRQIVDISASFEDMPGSVLTKIRLPGQKLCNFSQVL
jgi:hypothetical protein